MTLIAPSVLSADFSNLRKEIDIINNSLADWLHVDVMDGVFVPNISFGQPIIKHIKKYSNKPLDVHLMIIKPERYLNSFKEAGADLLSVHFEACTHLHRTIYSIKNLGMKAGVVINPSTPVSALEDIVSDADFILIMSVNPGFGGQQFIENSYNKIERLKNLIDGKNAKCLIEVDGGVSLINAEKLVGCGVDILVAGNSVFNSDNPSEVIKKMKYLKL